MSQKISLTFILQKFLRLTSQDQTQPRLLHIPTISLHLPLQVCVRSECVLSVAFQIHIQTTKNRRRFSKDVIRVWNDMRVSKHCFIVRTVLWHQAVKHYYSQPFLTHPHSFFHQRAACTRWDRSSGTIPGRLHRRGHTEALHGQPYTPHIHSHLGTTCDYECGYD